MAKMAIEALVQGRVQGVGFRHFATDKAKKLNLVGFVKNRADGNVLFYGEGEWENLKKMEEYLKEGPPLALVTNVKTNWGEAQGQYDDFNVAL